jgi:hypothetical protein
MPEPLDFFEFGPIKALLDNASDDTAPRLRGMIHEWRKEITAEFLRVLKSNINHITEPSAEMDDIALDQKETKLKSVVEDPNDSNLQNMELASTVYKCTRCSLFEPLSDWTNYGPDVDPSSEFPWTA